MNNYNKLKEIFDDLEIPGIMFPKSGRIFRVKELKKEPDEFSLDQTFSVNIDDGGRISIIDIVKGFGNVEVSYRDKCSGKYYRSGDYPDLYEKYTPMNIMGINGVEPNYTESFMYFIDSKVGREGFKPAMVKNIFHGRIEDGDNVAFNYHEKLETYTHKDNKYYYNYNFRLESYYGNERLLSSTEYKLSKRQHCLKLIKENNGKDNIRK